jgi:hypothetical protein
MRWFYPRTTRGQASIATFVKLRQAGMPAVDVIRAVTVSAAEHQIRDEGRPSDSK